MKTFKFVLVSLGALILVACGPDNSKPKLFEDQRNALDKAKAVESTVQQQTEQLQQSAEKQTQ